MNTKRILAAALGVATYVVGAALLHGYGNVTMHPAINRPIIDRFIEQFVNTISRPAKLKNTIFVFDGSTFYEGPAITNPGFFPGTTQETMEKKTPAEWILHGGFSADEPEIPAALRHFFDPLGIDKGKKYLTDRGTYWEPVVNNGTFNPHIDAKTWALHHADNDWSWDVGKKWVRQALESESEATRNAYMARAWRCLGETLHLIADMGCPSHVRNDSHAAPLGWSGRHVLGDPDPYEELVKPSYVTDYAKAAVDPSLKTDCRAATKADVLFDRLATFTNGNFFTAQTICGRGAKEYNQLIQGRPNYPSPKLESFEYNTTDFTYYKTFPGGQRVKMCKDQSYWFFRGYPYLDEECVKSQSSVLFPNIMEAGANLIRLFIPSISVTVTSASTGGRVQGTVLHNVDQEYTTAAACRGDVFIVINNAVAGKCDLNFDGTFDIAGLPLKSGDNVAAEYRLGGMFFRSEAVTVASYDNSKLKAVSIRFHGKHTFTQSGVVARDIELHCDSIRWTGDAFSGRTQYRRSDIVYTGFVEGTVNAAGTMITSLTGTYNLDWDGGIRKRTELHCRSIPRRTTSEFGADGNSVRNLIETIVFTQSYPGSPSDDYVRTDWSSTPLSLSIQFWE